MQRSRGSIRALLWTFASALFLKAAVPLFAVAAAHLQGVPVGSVCNIYGVTLPGAAHDPHAQHHGHHGHHGHPGDASPAGDAPAHSGAEHRDHCALSGLAAMAVPDVAIPQVTLAAVATPDRRRIDRLCVGDACAAWAARMQHPPPHRA